MTNPTDGRPAPETRAPDANKMQASSDDPLDATEDGAGELKHQAKAQADAIGQQARDVTEDVKRQARDAAEQAREHVRSITDRQKQAAAGQVSGFARALRSASGDLEGRGQEFAARYLEQAAGGLERVSESLERRDLDDLVAGVEDFARRQPIAFLGGAVVAGFGLARLMKSSAERHRSGGAGEVRSYAPTATPAGGSPRAAGATPRGTPAALISAPAPRRRSSLGGLRREKST